MMFVPLTENLGAELLTWFLAAFPAKTFLQQERGRVLQEHEAGCGQNLQESLMKFELDTHSWKIRPSSENEDWIESSPTLPKSGMMRNGVCLEQETAEGRIEGKECGFWATPRASKIAASATMKVVANITNPRGNLEEHIWARSGKPLSGVVNPQFPEWLMGWPLSWTELCPLGMDKFQLWLQRHGISCDKG